MTAEVNYISFSQLEGEYGSDSLAFGVLEGVKTRMNFLLQDQEVGYIDFSIYQQSCELIFIKVHKEFRTQGLSHIFMKNFLQLLQQIEVTTLWTEGYTDLGRQRRMKATQKIAEIFGIEYISGIQKA